MLWWPFFSSSSSNSILFLVRLPERHLMLDTKKTQTHTQGATNKLVNVLQPPRGFFFYNETVPTETFCQYLLLLWMLLLLMMFLSFFFIGFYFNVTTSKSASRCDWTILNLETCNFFFHFSGFFFRGSSAALLAMWMWIREINVI